jgi:flagellar biosynthesis chaperone FliJ
MAFKKSINIETFNSKLEVIITDTVQKEIKKVYDLYKVKYEDPIEVEGVLINVSIEKYHLLIDKKYLTHNTLAHEIYHATVRITEDRDVVDEETQAWLCGYITQKIYEFIKLKKLEIK